METWIKYADLIHTFFNPLADFMFTAASPVVLFWLIKNWNLKESTDGPKNKR